MSDQETKVQEIKSQEIKAQETKVETREVEKSKEKQEEYFPRNEFDNPEYRKRIESKLPKFNVEELLEKGRLTQVVRVNKNLEVMFCTTEAGPDSMMDKIALEYDKQGELYIRVLSMLQLAGAIVYINSQPISQTFVEYSKDKEKEYEQMLREKLDYIRNTNSKIVSLLSIHQVWFSERVSKFMKEDFIDSFENF